MQDLGNRGSAVRRLPSPGTMQDWTIWTHGAIVILFGGDKDMTKKPESTNQKQTHQAVPDHPLDLQGIRKALIRLRQLAADLPQVDAVSVVRESRDAEQPVD
jgi:hypothetical protein